MHDHIRLYIIYKIFATRERYYRDRDPKLFQVYHNCKTMVEYAIEGNDECLVQFDYIDKIDDRTDEPDDIDSDMGYDPYMGSYTDDC